MYPKAHKVDIDDLTWTYTLNNQEEGIDSHWTDINIIYGTNISRPQLILRENLAEHKKLSEEVLQKTIYKLHFE
jgi:hypothetical protein